jgi:F0F1-type ATP synthase alpha subunit
VFGIAFNVDEDEIGVVLLGEYSHILPETRSGAPDG